VSGVPPVALLGAGRWGINHARTLHELGALAAVVEPDRSRHGRIAEVAPDVPVYTSPEAVWSDQAITGVVLATPAKRHPDDVEAALRAGKDVLVEKPMALEAGAARRMAELADACDRLLMVGHLLLYQPAIAWMRETIASGVIGEVCHVETRRLNLGKVRQHENVLWSFAPHDLAVVQYLLGEPQLQSVTANAKCMLQPEVEDLFYADFAFACARSAHVHVSWWWPQKIRTTTVLATKGVMVFDELAGTVMLQPATYDAGDDVLTAAAVQTPEVAAAQPLTLECRHFLDAIATRTVPRSHGWHGVAVTEMLMSAEKAKRIV